MEQPDPSVTADIPSPAVPPSQHQPQPQTQPQTQPRPQPQPPTSPSATRLANSEPSPSNSPDQLSNSIPSLRFPRPLGNRQLTNWVSSSSPDIMQPGILPDDDPSLTELGYDIIGTDGESQAESTTSSFDYQRPDDVQSLAGTDTGTDVDTNDADTDSSDDEEATLNDTDAANDGLAADNVGSEVDEADVETLANQSLENPTSLSQHDASSILHRLAHADQAHTRGLLAAMHEFSSAPTSAEVEDDCHVEKVKTQTPSLPNQTSSWTKVKEHFPFELYRMACNHIRERRNAFILLSGLVVLYSALMAGKFLLFSSTVPRELSTVPVASVSSAVVPSSTVGTSLSTSVSVSTLTTPKTQEASQTDSISNSLVFMPYHKDKAQTSTAGPSLQQTVCSVALYSRNEIMVKIPQNIKSSWLAKDAIMIAVSRGVEDIPTKISFVSEGFLIQVPLDDAHGIMAVSIATTRKPKVNETFQVNFGSHMLTEALDAGKQLVRGFAQKVVDTVNETTAWVEETYIPAFDVMSKQVCDQTASVSDSLLQGLRDASTAVLTLPARILFEAITQIRQSLARDRITQRADQAHMELNRQAQDVRDELSLGLLTAQLNSKLWWLKMQGKTGEYQRYQGKAEAYWKEKRANADTARYERAERVKKQVRARRKQEGREGRGCQKACSFWNKGTGGS